MFLKDIPYNLEQYVNPNPTTVIGGVSIITDINPFGVNARIMHITAGSGFGFVDIATSKKWFMRVNHKLDYEVGFWFRQPITQPCFELSINAFSQYDVSKTIVDSTNGITENRWIQSTERVVGIANTWYFARYIIFGSTFNLEPGLQPRTSLSAGRNLVMQDKTVNVIINLLCKNQSIDIYDFKFKPLSTKFSTGFVQGSKIIEIWRQRNNNLLTEDKVNNVARNYLLPYNVANIPIELNY